MGKFLLPPPFTSPISIASLPGKHTACVESTIRAALTLAPSALACSACTESGPVGATAQEGAQRRDCQPQADPAALTIAHIFASPSPSGPTPKSLKFSPHGTRGTFLRAKDEDRTVLDL